MTNGNFEQKIKKKNVTKKQNNFLQKSLTIWKNSHMFFFRKELWKPL